MIQGKKNFFKKAVKPEFHSYPVKETSDELVSPIQKKNGKFLFDQELNKNAALVTK